LLVLALSTSILASGSGLLSALAQMTDSDTLDVTAVVPSATPPGGGGGTGSVVGTTVTMSGFSFPNAKLTLLKDGQVATTLIANPDGTFQITMHNLNFGNYQFSIFAEDPLGVVSSSHTLNVSAFEQRTYAFSSIIIPPTISASRLVVKIGGEYSVFGYAPAGSTVNLLIPGSSNLGSAIADSSGFYRITTTASLPAGTYSIRVNATVGAITSQYSKPIQMLFSRSDVVDLPPPPSQYATCVDYNRDGRVNLIDFSILLFWFGKNNPPNTIDCNGDRVIDIKDFSILMYFWTG
jgi:hypothetical protein